MRTMTLAKEIRRRREAKGWKRVDLSRLLGCCQSSINNWEDRGIAPSWRNLTALAELFGCRVGFYDEAS